MSMVNDRLTALPGPDDTTRVELDNGIIVLARENFMSPSVVIDGMVWGGAVYEGRAKAGLAQFATRVMTHGTQRYPFQEFYELIESNGASLDLSSGRHTLSFGTKSLAEDLPLMLELLSEVLRAPTFPAQYIEKVRGQMMTELRYREQSTRSMAGLHFRELAYPEGHPYHRSTSGYLDSVPAITREDLMDVHGKIGPQGAIFVVVGAVKAEEAVEQVRAVFGDWTNPDQPEPPRSVDDVKRLSDVRQGHVAISGKSQSDIVFGYPGPQRSAPDYQAARMTNNILGRFGMYGRLGDNIREKQGLAYYSYSSISGGLGPAPWQVSAGVSPENVDKTIQSIRTEIRRMTDEPVTRDEIEDNKSYFKGHLVLGLETNEGVAGTLQSMELHGLGLDYLHNYHEMIDAIDIPDIQTAARKYLSADAYAVAIAGPTNGSK